MNAIGPKTCVSTLVFLRLWLDAAASVEAVAAAADVFDLVAAAAAAAAAPAAACRLDETSHSSRLLRYRRMCAAASVVTIHHLCTSPSTIFLVLYLSSISKSSRSRNTYKFCLEKHQKYSRYRILVASLGGVAWWRHGTTAC